MVVVTAPTTVRTQSHRDWRSPATVFGVAFLIAFGVALLAGPKPFDWDAAGYWNLGQGFVRNGRWSLLNLGNPVRGYGLGLVYGCLRAVADLFGAHGAASTVVKAFNAVLLAAIGTLLGPRLAQLTWPHVRFGPVRRFALFALLLILWRGYLNFPLSDFPALVMALLALVAVARDSPLHLLAGGVCAGVAIDMRPAYILLAPAVLVLALVRRPEADETWSSPRRRILGLLMVVLGIAIISLPQSLISHRQFDTWSPLPGAAAGLTSFQLTAGLELQRYETYVGRAQRSPQIRYLDPHTSAIVAALGRDGVVNGYADYVGIIVEHPVTMAGVFVRHVVNGMDQRYSTPYVEELDTGQQRPMRMTSLLLAFVGLLRLVWPAARRGLGPARWRYPVSLLLTCVPSLPSAIETRFLLPAYVLCGVLALAPGWPARLGLGPPEAGVRRFAVPAAITTGCLAFLAATLAIAAGASAHLS